MIEIIPTEDGLRIESHTPVDDSFVNKINNPVNKDRINAHLKDLKCEHHIEINNGPISVLVFSTYEKKTQKEFETMLKVIEVGHDSFIENVERMKEVINFEDDKATDQDEEQEKKLKAAAAVLKRFDETFEDDDTIIFGRPVTMFFEACGEISVAFMKELLDCYIDKHLQNDNK